MSTETLLHLNRQVLVGFTEKRGRAWHYQAELQGDEPNHYRGGVPVGDVERRLFGWEPVEAVVQAVVLGPEGVTTVTDETRKAIVRPDTGRVLGVFSSSYQPHDYKTWLVDSVARLLDDDALQIGSAGLLKEGAVAWVQVEMDESREVEGVGHRPFLTAATSLDGSLATTYGVGSQVVVCDNTLSVALGNFESRHKVKHSARSLGRLQHVRDALRLVVAAGDAFDEQVRQLCAERVSEARFERFVKVWASPSDEGSKRAASNAAAKADALRELWCGDPRVSPWRGTGWGVVAGVNTYTQHVAPIRGADRVTRNRQLMVTGAFNQLDAGTLELLRSV